MDTTTPVTETAWNPVDYANYRGDVRSILSDGPKGPNTLGEMLWPVTAIYDPATNRTRVGFSPVPPSAGVSDA